MGGTMRDKLKAAFDRYFTQGSGATETMLMLFGAFITVRELATGDRSERTLSGVNEMLFGFTVGLPLGNPFWQRASVVLFPVLASAQLELALAAEYAAAEKRLPPNDPRAAELRRKAAQCMGGFYSLALMALVADRGVPYAEQNARAMRDELSAIMEGST